MYGEIPSFSKLSVSIIGVNAPGESANMITNTAAYTIVAVAYVVFAVATWFMFTM